MCIRDRTEGGLAIDHKNVVQGARLIQNKSDTLNFACQFLRNGVIFSKLAPYKDWVSFTEEGLRFWNYFQKVAKPLEVSSLSVRYISQIQIESSFDVSKHIGGVCEPLNTLGLDSNSFYHQDTFLLSDKPYGINVVRAVRTSEGSVQNLIVDITAHTTSAITDPAQIDKHLKDLRFTKNKVFFSLIKNPVQTFGVDVNV